MTGSAYKVTYDAAVYGDISVVVVSHDPGGDDVLTLARKGLCEEYLDQDRTWNPVMVNVLSVKRLGLGYVS